MNNNLHLSYKIDEADDIIFVSDAWSAFALANGAPELVGEKVLNRSLWNFVTDETTREVYRQMINKVRGKHSVSFDFRCDSPDTRRFLEMKITLWKDKTVRFDTRLICAEKRVRQNVFQKDARRGGSGVIVVCSWCNKVETDDGKWREIEDAAADLKIFESENIPQMSHGMCASCYEVVTAKHQSIFGVGTVA